MQRVALYIRVSTEEQAVHGLSIEAQTDALDAWAKSSNVIVVGHYIDAGISARKPAAKRPELQRLLNDAQAGKIDLIVFTKLDRWFRNIAEYYKVQETLEANKVDWKTIHEDYDTSTASGRLKINIMLSVAQDEADRTSERIKAVFESKLDRNEAISGCVPLGFKLENGHLTVDDSKAEIVRYIFEEYISLRSLKALRRALMDKYGITYTDRGLKMLLMNKRYIGHAHGKSDFCPTIIDPDTFSLVQQIVQQRAQRNSGNFPKRLYLFTGIVFCAECGSRMNAHTVNGKYIYYRCSSYERWKTCPHTKRTSEIKLEDWLLHNLTSCIEAYNLEIDAKKKLKKTPVDESAIKRKMEKLKDLYLNDLIEREDYERDYIALRDKLRAVHESEQNIQKPIDITAVKGVLDIYSSLSRQGQKEFWGRTISKIIITNNGDFSVVPFSP